MTADQLATLGIGPSWLEPLQSAFARFGIDNTNRQAAFIGQCQHESGNFKTLVENLNYGAYGLTTTWPARFPTLASAAAYARQPEKIANHVYANRMGNGDELSGDGWAYKGRGLIQLTGKNAYTLAGDALGADFMRNPDVVAQPTYAALTAGWFWSTNRLNICADAQDWVALTRKINGGVTGLPDRISLINKALEVLA